MSVTEPKQAPKKQKNKETKSLQPSNGSERLKTVVRRLPPNLPEEIFWQTVQTWVTDDTVSWKVYHQGKMRKRVNKESVPSRAYIAFKNEEQLAIFSREYDGHLFRDKAGWFHIGNESQAVVEFAPYQKIPTEKRKVDARNNTIEQDEDYVSFLESLKNSIKAEPVTLETLIAASQPPPQPTTTPLLEALRAEKSAQKDKETIFRNHAHYKDPATSVQVTKKEEAKKKTAAPHTAKPPEPGPTGKKAKKAATAAAVQKATSSQDTQTLPSKILPSNSTVPPPPAAPRARPPREPHGRQHSSKGLVSASAPQSTPDTAALTQTNPEGALASASTFRRARPVIGVDRHFTAALNGAGVVVAGGERKKRDKDRDSGSAPSDAPGKGKESSKHKGEKGPRALVPSILQRADDSGGHVGDVLNTQQPLSPRSSEASGANPDLSTGRGGKRGRGRGRGGNRGG
ncbi:Smg-4/UPF3 family-domain-containing protein [Phlebopus sp. FC_14]|nr:Smg-4/UPF3 family-domain-containing protein [Phlebopus sp. FC_14]